MALTERVLEENEAKIDNILHKILLSVRRIAELNAQIKNETKKISDEDLREYVDARCRRVELLTQILDNLVVFADFIDIKDERLTKEIEQKIRSELKGAIESITEAEKFLE